MHTFDHSTADSTVNGVLTVTRWEQFPAVEALPFGGMWYSVAPLSASPLDQHPDVELSLVMRGDAEVETGGRRVRVPQGSAFLLDSSEGHVIHNPSPDTPLLIFSAYWMPPESGDGDTSAGQ
jgi:mannose-6-phosphate isomerase-like protein (cupin superfamily)